MKTLRRLILPMILCAVLLTGGVYGLFYYQNEKPSDVSVGNDISMEVFGYPPDEIIPGGGDNDDPIEVGNDHMELIHNIVYHKSYGLNATHKPIIHEVLSEDGNVIYCDQNVQGGNLKHLAIDKSDNSQKLYFVISRKSATEYHAFTMRQLDVNRTVGTRITVYKTLLIKGSDGKWIYTLSYKGMAEVNNPSITGQAIDVNTFIAD